MEIAVVGGTGTLGRRTADRLESRGHHVRRVSHRYGTHRADLITGDGLQAALDGVETVVNASNEPSAKRASSVLVAGSERLLRASSAHHVCVSIVGIEELARHAAYYRVKLEQEQRVRESGVPFMIVRATQTSSRSPSCAAGKGCPFRFRCHHDSAAHSELALRPTPLPTWSASSLGATGWGQQPDGLRESASLPHGRRGSPERVTAAFASRRQKGKAAEKLELY
jgi:hypothetical protein